MEQPLHTFFVYNDPCHSVSSFILLPVSSSQTKRTYRFTALNPSGSVFSTAKIRHGGIERSGRWHNSAAFFANGTASSTVCISVCTARFELSTIAVAFRCDAVSISRRSGSVSSGFVESTIPVYDVRHLVPGSLDLPMQLPERRSAHVVAARIDKNIGVLHIKDGEDLRRQHRVSSVVFANTGAMSSTPSFFEQRGIIRRAEIRVHDVHIDNNAASAALRRLCCQIQHEIGLSAAVMPANDRNGAFHALTLSSINKAVRYSSSYHRTAKNQPFPPTSPLYS